VLLRLLLVGYLYGITSERRLFEEARMHLVWRQHHGTCGTTYVGLPSLHSRQSCQSIGDVSLVDGVSTG